MTRLIRELLAGLVRLITGARAVVGTSDTNTKRSVLDLPPQMILYANHSSHLDFVTIWSVVPRRIRDRLRPIAAGDYWGSGMKHWLASNVLNAYLVDRGTRPDHGAGADRGMGADQRAGSDRGMAAGQRAGAVHDARADHDLDAQGRHQRADQVADMLAILDAGDSLLIFPEGTRGDGTDVGRFHSGLFRLAQARPEIPVVPVALSNLGRMLPKGSFVPVPHLVTATFLDELQLEPDEERSAYLERARQAVAQVVREAEEA